MLAHYISNHARVGYQHQLLILTYYPNKWLSIAIKTRIALPRSVNTNSTLIEQSIEFNREINQFHSRAHAHIVEQQVALLFPRVHVV